MNTLIESRLNLNKLKKECYSSRNDFYLRENVFLNENILRIINNLNHILNKHTEISKIDYLIKRNMLKGIRIEIAKEFNLNKNGLYIDYISKNYYNEYMSILYYRYNILWLYINNNMMNL